MSPYHSHSNLMSFLSLFPPQDQAHQPLYEFLSLSTKFYVVCITFFPKEQPLYESLPGDDDWDKVSDDEAPAENVDVSANEEDISQLQVFRWVK